MVKLLSSIFCFTFGHIFYVHFFLPCWQCYDFEAAIAHEIGHVLGFGHPDTAPHENLEQSSNLTNATCASPCSPPRSKRSRQRTLRY